MREIELLLCQILNCNRADLYLNKIFEPVNRKEFYFVNLDISSLKDRLNQWEPERILLLGDAIKRRINGEPLQYILGSQEFMGLEFKVSPRVFIPRPETEILVEKAMEILNAKRYSLNAIQILDIGTGSGCIAISLAKNIANAHIVAIDISQDAIKLAKENAQLHGVGNKIEFIRADIFAICNLQFAICNFDMIISNPPYIPTNDIDKLAKEISFEPRIALDGGVDGLEFYRKIILKATPYLKDDGMLLMEMGFHQAEAIKDITRASRRFEIIEVLQDYSGIERVLVAKVTRNQLPETRKF